MTASALQSHTLPSRLYKYQPVTALSLQNLKMRTLWSSAPANFNDPFDCALQVARLDLSEDDLNSGLEYVRSRAKLSPSLEAQLVTDGKPNENFRAVLVKSVEGAFEEQRQRQLHQRGVASLSAKYDDMLMWGYYADGHRGFCLEFDT